MFQQIIDTAIKIKLLQMELRRLSAHGRPTHDVVAEISEATQALVDAACDINFDRCAELVASTCQRSFYATGLRREFPDPYPEARLVDMAAANAALRAYDAELRRITPGPHTVHVIADDRLVAAAYALERYPADPVPDPVVLGRGRALVVCQLDEDEQAEMDAAP